MRKDFGIFKRTRDKKGYYYYSFYDEDGVRRYRSTGERLRCWTPILQGEVSLDPLQASDIPAFNHFYTEVKNA